MNYDKNKISLTSNAVEYQFPSFVREDNLLFVSFLKNYYKSLESKFQPLDLVDNLINYYNIEYFTPNNLIFSTKLTANIDVNNTNINVVSTKGFPEKNGFIQIDDEIIYYKSKTLNQFIQCTRGSSSFTFIDRNKSKLNYSTSIPNSHLNNTTVINLAYIFADEFLTRIKNELIPNIPKYISSELNYVNLLSNIKSFYLSKGSPDSIKFLFRLIYNEKDIILKLKPRGSGAKILLNSIDGKLTNYIIINGGTGYSNSPSDFPIIEIIGNGEDGFVRVKTVQAGSITEIEILNSGKNYRGIVEVLIREKQFTQEQIVVGQSSNAIGYVKYWESNTNKLTLYNLVGNFNKNEIIIGSTNQNQLDNNVKAIIDSYEIIPIDSIIEYPNEYLFTPSNSVYIEKRYIKCEILSGNINSISNGQGYYLEQLEDLDFNVKNTKISVGIINKIYQTNEKNIIEICLENKSNDENFFLPPSTNLFNINGNIITVDNTIGFPLSNGIIQIDDEVIVYSSKTVNQFLNCIRGYLSTNIVNHSGGSLIELIGRKVSNTNNKFYNLKLFTSNKNEVLELKLLGLPGKITFDDKGSLYVENFLEEQTDFHKQTTNSLYSKWRLTSNSTGVNSIYDYKDHVYIAASSIPDYSNNQIRDVKNQKIVRRIPKNKKPFNQNNSSYKNNLGITISGIEILNSHGKIFQYGSIEKLTIKNSGTGYLVKNDENTKPKIKILAQNTESELNIQPNELKINGSFVSITLDGINSEELKNFTSKPFIVITNELTDTTGNSAEIDCVFLNNEVKKLIIKSSGNSYTKIPTVTIVGGGKNTIITIPSSNIIIKGGLFFNTIDKISLPVLYGNTYDTNVTVKVTTGQDAQVYAQVSNGSIISLFIDNAGFDYVVSPDIKIIGTGTNAKAKAYIQNGRVVNVEIIDPGYGYIYPPIIEVIPIGSDSEIVASLTNWQYNLPEVLPLDNCGGYVYSDIESKVISNDSSANFNVFNGINTEFKTTSNGFVVNGNLILFRNGIHQTPENTYINNSFFVNFIIPPTANEEIHGKCFTANSEYINFNNRTNTEITLTGNPNITSGILLVFLDGVIQTFNVNTNESFGFTYNNVNKKIIFDESISSFIEISVLWYKQSIITLDSIQITSISTLSYNLTLNNNSYVPANKGGLLVIIDNVVQKFTTDNLLPGSYTIENNIITFSEINDLNIGSTIRMIYFENDLKHLDEMNETVNSIQQEFKIIKDDNKYVNTEFFNTSIDRNCYYLYKLKNQLEFEYNISPSYHSPLIGWAYDGNPIYGKYGYVNPLDQNSGITEIISAYELITEDPTSRNNRPSEYPLGSLIEDWTFNPSISTLDKSNGRFCKTPEFPNGTYAYFATSNYPYFFGSTLHDDIDIYNIQRCRSNDSIPSQFERIKYLSDIYYPKPKNLTGKNRIKIEELTTGGVDSVYIENSGNNYKVNEKLIIDDSNTGGSGFRASILSIQNVNVLSAINDSTLKRITITTDNNHGLESENIIYVSSITYNVSQIFKTHTLNINGSSVSLDGNTNTSTIFTISNKKYVINLTNSISYSMYLSRDKEGQIQFYTPNTNISNSSITFITTDLPSVFYLNVYNMSSDTIIKTYQIYNQTEPYLGKFKIYKINNTSFYYEIDYSYPNTYIDNIYYSTTNKTVLGKIDKIKILDRGFNYKILPNIIGIDSQTGSGAIIQPDSTTIGKIKKIKYQNTGDYYHSNQTINYQIKSDAVIKVSNNFEIYEIEIINSGSGYSSEPKIYVDGYENSQDFEFKSEILNGRLVNVNVIKRGSFLSNNPNIIVNNLNTGGSGAVVKSKIRRKKLKSKTQIYYGSSFLDSNTLSAEIVNFESNGSVLQIKENFNIGKFNKNDNYILFDYLGNKYGKIIRIDRTNIQFKSSYINEESSYFETQSGFLNNNSQRLQDGNYYQKYSYAINYNQNIKDWKNEIISNVHPAGFKVFNKNYINSYNSFHTSMKRIIQDNIGFDISIKRNIFLKVNESSIRQQILYLFDDSILELKENNYIIGTTSKTLGKIISVGENFIVVEIIKGLEFNQLDYILSLNLNNIQINNTIICINGVLQYPFLSYINFIEEIASIYSTGSNTLVTAQKLVNTYFDIIQTDFVGNTSNTTTYILNRNNILFIPNSKNNLIFSVNGIIQDPDTFSLNNYTLTLSENISAESKCFTLYFPNINKLTITQVNSTTYNISPSVSNKNQLLIFTHSVPQNVIDNDIFTLNNNGNQIVFNESVSSIYGWSLNDTIDSSKLDFSFLDKFKVCGYNNLLRKHNLVYKIETNNIKNPNNFYEIKRKKLQGFLYSSSTSPTTIFGFKTKFKYSNPEYSASYVEVLNQINNFNGIDKTFNLTYLNNTDYVYSNTDSYCINLDGIVLIQNIDYTINNSTITFTNAPSIGSKCTITVFCSSFNSSDLDFLNKSFNGVNTTFNLVKDGVALYVYRQGDVLVFRNNILQKINTNIYSIHNDKITFVNSPQSNETIKLVYFRRLLDPVNHHNFLIDDFLYFNGITTQFAITSNGISISGNLILFRNGVFQYPTSGYINNLNNITFIDAPTANEEIHGKCFTANSEYINFNNRTNTEITLTGNPNITSGILLVFLDGVIQTFNVNTNESFGFTYNNVNKKIIFDESISSFIEISVLWYKQSIITLDSIQITSISTLSYNLTLNNNSYVPANKGGLLVIIDNVVQKFTTDNLLPGSYTIENNIITFSEINDLNIGSTIRMIYFENDLKHLDEMNETVNGIRKKFRILNNFNNYGNSSSDLFVFINGIAQKPITSYTVSNSYITFTNAPNLNDDIFIIAMYGNEDILLNYISGTTYELSRNLTNTEKNSLFVLYNNSPQFLNSGFTFTSNNRITFDNSLNSNSEIFAILLRGAILTDEINTPFDGIRKTFTLFKNSSVYYSLNGELFPQNLIITKNGGILESGIDYTILSPDSKITFTIAPISTDKINVKSYGEFIKLDNVTTNTSISYNLTLNSLPYYVNSIIDRPRNYENQILAIYNNTLLSPLTDYYIENNQIILKFIPSNNQKLVLLDYRGNSSDVEVKSYYENIHSGDVIKITGESNYRTVTSVLSPTVLTTSLSSQNLQNGFSGTANISNGMIQSITINNSGKNYAKDTYIIPYGCGSEALGQITTNQYGEIQTINSIGGYNYYIQPSLIVANSAYIINKRLLEQNEVKRLYKLQSNINSTIDNNIQLNTTANLPTSPWSLSVITNSTGSGAILVPHISNGKVVKVSILNGGSNYDDTDIKIDLIGQTSSNGSGARFEPILDLITGSIIDVVIKNEGYGYDSYKLIIGMELIEYTQISSEYIRGCTRGSGNTISTSHTTSEYVIYNSII